MADLDNSCGEGNISLDIFDHGDSEHEEIIPVVSPIKLLEPEWKCRPAFIHTQKHLFIEKDNGLSQTSDLFDSSKIMKQKNRVIKEVTSQKIAPMPLKETIDNSHVDENNYFNTTSSHRQRVDAQIQKVVSEIKSPEFVAYQNGALERVLNKHREYAELHPRLKSSRRLMNGYECPCCSAYYDTLGLNAADRKKHVNRTSKHRGFEERPLTPPHYWELDIPSPEEQERRGWVQSTDEPLFKSKAQKKRLALLSKTKPYFKF